MEDDLTFPVFCEPFLIYYSDNLVVCRLLKRIDVELMVNKLALSYDVWFEMYQKRSSRLICMRAAWRGEKSCDN